MSFIVDIYTRDIACDQFIIQGHTIHNSAIAIITGKTWTKDQEEQPNSREKF